MQKKTTHLFGNTANVEGEGRRCFVCVEGSDVEEEGKHTVDEQIPDGRCEWKPHEYTQDAHLQCTRKQVTPTGAHVSLMGLGTGAPAALSYMQVVSERALVWPHFHSPRHCFKI